MAHLSRDTLIAWRDRPTESARTEVVSHLASCPTCAAVYAELVRVRPPGSDAPPGRLNPEDFKARGHAALISPRRFRLPRWLLVPLAAAAAVVLVVTLTRRDGTDDAPVVRGGNVLRTIAPAGAVSSVAEFMWDAPEGADAFRLTVIDSSGQMVHEARVRGNRYALPADVAATLVRGTEYGWTISRVDARGETLETTPVAAFRLR